LPTLFIPKEDELTYNSLLKKVMTGTAANSCCPSGYAYDRFQASLVLALRAESPAMPIQPCAIPIIGVTVFVSTFSAD